MEPVYLFINLSFHVSSKSNLLQLFRRMLQHCFFCEATEMFTGQRRVRGEQIIISGSHINSLLLMILGHLH